MKNTWIIKGKLRSFERYLSMMVFGIKFADISKAQEYITSVYHEENEFVKDLIKCGVSNIYLNYKFNHTTFQIEDIELTVNGHK